MNATSSGALFRKIPAAIPTLEAAAEVVAVAAVIIIITEAAIETTTECKLMVPIFLKHYFTKLGKLFIRLFWS